MRKLILVGAVVTITIGLILFLDQLFLFGLPFGGFLPDLSRFDPTGSQYFRHWMIGLVLVLGGSLVMIYLVKRD